MSGPEVVPASARPGGRRGVPLLTEPSVGHYPEFRRFLSEVFGLDDDRVGGPGLLRLDDRYYELVFLGRSGRPFPSGVEIHALVPGVEPLDEAEADRDLWRILQWVVAGVGGDWSVEALWTTGRILRIPTATEAEPEPPEPERPSTELLAFDLYGTLLDPLAIAGELGRLLPGPEADQVAATWRRTQIDFAFRLTAMGRYEPFDVVTARALDLALDLAGRADAVGEHDRTRLLESYDVLPAFPDVLPALRGLAASGVEMAVLTNGSRSMVDAGLEASGLGDFFGHVISVDEVRAYKPHPAVYRHAAAVTGRPLEAIRLVSCNPFDVVGAAEAGTGTIWVNRSGGPFDTLGARPDRTLGSLTELTDRPARREDRP